MIAYCYNITIVITISATVFHTKVSFDLFYLDLDGSRVTKQPSCVCCNSWMVSSSSQAQLLAFRSPLWYSNRAALVVIGFYSSRFFNLTIHYFTTAIGPVGRWSGWRRLQGEGFLLAWTVWWGILELYQRSSSWRPWVCYWTLMENTCHSSINCE